jgi:cell division protein FtsB
MLILTEIRKRAGIIAGPVFAISLLAYFGYHLVEGERGLSAWMRLTQDLKAAQARLGGLEAERQALDNRVGLLRPEHIDRDMLDEQARATLNLAAPNDIVIFKAR